MHLQDVQQPKRSLQESVLLEVDVASFTSGRQGEQAGVPTQHQGKYLGLLHQAQRIRSAAFQIH